MEPEEVFKQPPVYKWEQCITEDDLQDAIELLLQELDMTPEVQLWDRHGLIVAAKTLATMLDWIKQGKPQSFEFRDI